jgi:hypothetical protein
MKKLLLTALLLIGMIGRAQLETPKEIIHDHYNEHYAVGVFISFTTGQALRYYVMPNRPGLCNVIGIGVAVIAGISKEAIWDKRMHLGVCNNESAYVTMWGGLQGGMINIPLMQLEDKKGFVSKRWQYEELGTDTLTIKTK